MSQNRRSAINMYILLYHNDWDTLAGPLYPPLMKSCRLETILRLRGLLRGFKSKILLGPKKWKQKKCRGKSNCAVNSKNIRLLFLLLGAMVLKSLQCKGKEVYAVRKEYRRPCTAVCHWLEQKVIPLKSPAVPQKSKSSIPSYFYWLLQRTLERHFFTLYGP